MHYRPEIDGLRAIAVISVVFFHAGYAAFQGGYIGVDVFFVISGYLITSIILKELQNNTFSLQKFYERRIRRIFPAFIFIMSISTLLCWIYLLPDDMKVFSQTLAASTFFSANLYFHFKKNNYFGLHTEENPLLHTWSLSVEEQFYLVFPLLLLICWRIRKRAIVHLLIILALASFSAAEIMNRTQASAAFFLLHTRAWELLAGALIAVMPPIKYIQTSLVKNILSLLGLALIFFSIYFFDHQTPVPGYLTLIPILGTILTLLFASPDTQTAKILSHQLLVGIGLISFSLYLWHQPLFALNKYLSYQRPEPISFFYLTLLSGGLAYLTWKYIENPFRNKEKISQKWVFSSALILSLLLILFGVQGHINHGYPHRDPLFQRLVSNVGLSIGCNGNDVIGNAKCQHGSEPEVAFLGNSYAMHLIHGFKDTFPETHFVQLTIDSCEPHARDTRTQAGKKNCAEFHQRALKSIVESPHIKQVIISSPFKDISHGQNQKAFKQSLHQLAQAKKSILLIGPTPGNGNDFGRCFVRHRNNLSLCNFLKTEISREYFKIIETLQTLASQSPQIDFWDLTDLICKNELCQTSLNNGLLIYRDSGHLSVEGSIYIWQKLKESHQTDFPLKVNNTP